MVMPSTEINPNVVLRPSTIGFYGPGTYLTDSPVAASGTFEEANARKCVNRVWTLI